MLKKLEKIKSDELLILLTWLKGDTTFSKKVFKFDDLLKKCVDDNDIDIENDIDQLMIDLFEIYNKLNTISKEELKIKMEETIMFNILSKELVLESMSSIEKFIELYEKILMNTKFNYPEIRGIQKNIFLSHITAYTNSEEYEKCIELTTKLKEI